MSRTTSESDSGRVALVLCPTWLVDTPPLGVAYLRAALLAAGHDVPVFDFNAAWYREVADTAPELKDLWGGRAWFLSHESQLFPLLYPDRFPEPYHDFRDAHGARFRALAATWAEAILATEPQIVGFSVSCNTSLFSLLTAGALKARRPDVKVVFGGPNCPAGSNARVFLRSGAVDAVAVGEGEDTVVELVARWLRGASAHGLPGLLTADRGRIITGPPRPPIRDLDALPWPDFDGFDRDAYLDHLELLPILSSRGCVNRCEFCFDWPFWGRFRTRSAESLLAEIKHRVATYGTTQIFFADLLLNGNLKQLERLCDLLIAAGAPVSWWGNARVKPLMPPDLLAKMRTAGCSSLHYGLEHGSDRVLGLMAKGCTVAEYDQALSWAREAGIDVSAGFVLGYPGETETDLENTRAFLHRNRDNLYQVHVFALALMYGSPLWDRQAELDLVVPRLAFPTGLEWGRDYSYPFIGEWRSADGRNNEEYREEQVALMRDFCAELGLGHSRHGDDREDLYEVT